MDPAQNPEAAPQEDQLLDNEAAQAEDQPPEGDLEGADQGQEQEAEAEGEGGDDDTPPEPTDLPPNLTKFSDEFGEKGELSDESYTELAELGYSKAVVDAYISAVSSQVSESDADAIIESAGGADEFAKARKWASENLSDADKERYANAIANKNTAAFAVQWLMGEMKRKEGHDPATTIEPNAAPRKALAGYASRKEMTKALNDRRYGNDRAYTKQVEEMVIRTDLTQLQR